MSPNFIKYKLIRCKWNHRGNLFNFTEISKDKLKFLPKENDIDIIKTEYEAAIEENQYFKEWSYKLLMLLFETFLIYTLDYYNLLHNKDSIP